MHLLEQCWCRGCSRRNVGCAIMYAKMEGSVQERQLLETLRDHVGDAASDFRLSVQKQDGAWDVTMHEVPAQTRDRSPDITVWEEAGGWLSLILSRCRARRSLIFSAMIIEVPLATLDAGRMWWSSMPPAFVILGYALLGTGIASWVWPVSNHPRAVKAFSTSSIREFLKPFLRRSSKSSRIAVSHDLSPCTFFSPRYLR
jgi:hypothetical protein